MSNHNASIKKRQALSEEVRNPCYEEAQRSLKCQIEAYHQDSCAYFMRNYSACKMFWSEVIKLRRHAGIVPDVPAIEDRPAVMKKYSHLLREGCQNRKDVEKDSKVY